METKLKKANTPNQSKKEVLNPVDPVFVNTPTGTVAIFGHEHVSKKMLEVIGTTLSHDAFEITYHGVKSIVFRIDGYPKEKERPICANFAPDVCGVSVNMEKTLEKAMERSMDHPATSLMASWWIEMLLNLGHELHHAVRWDSERDKLSNDPKARAKEEELAENYSGELITALVQGYDIEPPPIAEEPWFDHQINELLSGKKDNDKWATDQQDMLNHNYLWKHTPKDGAHETIILQTFKDVVCLIMDGDETSEEWNKETIPVSYGIKSLDKQLNGEKVTLTQQPSTDENTYYDEDTDPIPPPVEPPISNHLQQTEAQRTEQPLHQTLPAQPTFQQNTGLQQDGATISRIAKQVYMKMYSFIFKNCGQLLNSDLGFSKPEAVCLTAIPLTDEEKIIFISMNHLDANGRWCTDVPTTNGLFGKVMKNTKLPSYEVFLNINGITHKRLLVPQNPAKHNTAGQLTQRAAEARAGGSIAYIIIPSDGPLTEYGPSIVNGQYTPPRQS